MQRDTFLNMDEGQRKSVALKCPISSLIMMK